MSKGTMLAIDYGTSNTTAVLAGDRPLERVKFGTDWRLPSAVLWSTDGPLVGADALHAQRGAPTRFVRCPKRELRPGPLILGDLAVPAVDLTTAVLDAVRQEVERQIGGRPSRVVVTLPVHWGTERRDLFDDAVRTAGLRNVQYVEEPVSAAVQIGRVGQIAEKQPFCVLDLGGGTLDVAVVVKDKERFNVLATGGDDRLGGEDVDDLLYRHVVRQLPADVESDRLRDSRDATWVHRRRLLRDGCRTAKENLARIENSYIDVPSGGEVIVSRHELADIARNLVERVAARTAGTVRGIGLDPRAVPVFLVGGSSRLAGLDEHLRRELCAPVSMIGDPQFAVAEGAALVLTHPIWKGRPSYPEARQSEKSRGQRRPPRPELPELPPEQVPPTAPEKRLDRPAQVVLITVAVIVLLVTVVVLELVKVSV